MNASMLPGEEEEGDPRLPRQGMLPRMRKTKKGQTRRLKKLELINQSK